MMSLPNSNEHYSMRTGNLVTIFISLIFHHIRCGLLMSIACFMFLVTTDMAIWLVLDPRIGYAGLKDDYTNDPDLLDGLEQSKVALESHFNQFYAGRASLTSTTTPQSLVTDLSSDNPQPHDFTARFRKRPKPLQNELEEFFSLFPQDFTSCNPVQWWYSNRNRFPNLYRLARDILAIPGEYPHGICQLDWFMHLP